MPGQYGIDILTQIDALLHADYEFYVLDESIKEIQKIIETQKGLHKSAAKLALEMIKVNKIKIKDTILIQERKKTTHVDDLLVAIAKAQPFQTVIATQDQLLKKRLKELKIQMIVLRGKTHLVLT